MASLTANSQAHKPIQLLVAGAAGRMGRCVLEAASNDPRFEIAGALIAPDDARSDKEIEIGNRRVLLANQWTPKKSSAPTSREPIVLIDFTVADGTIHWLPICEEFRIPLVIGATGHNDQQIARIRRAAQTIPIILAANFSTGLRVLLRLLPQLARALGPDTDIEIVETHHRRKIDAPSGTAKEILRVLQSASGGNSDIAYGRQGVTGPRQTGQIGVHSVRLGDTVGTHEIHFGVKGESITITHTAQSRDAFAIGALNAADWLINQPPGFYAINDVP